jgi:hypothetical protein
VQAGHAQDRGLKTTLCICFLLVFVALVLIDRNSPAAGYELSIYESVPLPTWICLIAALAGGTGVIVHQAFRDRKSKYWLLGWFVLAFGISVLLLLPTFKGYLLYGSDDTIAHGQFAERVLAEHHIWESNRYPITHILMAQIAQVCAVSPETLVNKIPVLFTLIFMFSTYLLASSVMPKKRQALLAAGTIGLFFNYYHVCVYPQTLSIMTLPFLFYLYFRSRDGHRLPFRIAFVTMLFVFPFFHPAPAAVLIFCLLAAEGVKVLWRLRGRSSSATAVMDRITLEPTLICSVTFLTWISTWAIAHRTLQHIVGWLTGEIKSVPRVKQAEQIFETQGVEPLQQVQLGLKMYGHNLIFLSLSALALLIVVWGFARKREELKRLSILCMSFLISGPVWVLIFTTTLYVTVGRLLGANVMMWAAPVLAAFALFEMFGRWQRAGMIAVTSILTCALILGVFSVFHSPYILQPSWHLTRHEVSGTEWFFAHTGRLERDEIATFGVQPAIANGIVSRFIPDHFGYTEEDSLGYWYKQSFFVLIGQRFRLSSTHPVLSKHVIADFRIARTGFDQSDFEELEQDSSVMKLFSNGELDVYLAKHEG